jgi:hypothetical protein
MFSHHSKPPCLSQDMALRTLDEKNPQAIDANKFNAADPKFKFGPLGLNAVAAFWVWVAVVNYAGGSIAIFEDDSGLVNEKWILVFSLFR